MMQLFQLFDPFLIKEALRRDELYLDVAQITSLDNWSPDTCICRWYLGIRDNTVVGLLLINVKTNSLYEFHGGVYKEYRGEGTEIVKDALDIIRNQDHCKFMTTIPSNNKPAQGLVLKLGLKEIGRITNGYKPLDMVIYAEEE